MKYRNTGFTLLEVLVALVVVSIGMSAALSLSVKSIDTLTEIEKRTYAHWFAQNLIVELKLKSIRTVGVIEGSDKLAGYKWYWKAEIKPTSDQDVLQLQMFVSSTENFDKTMANITSYLSAT